jgi:hypothetical protein
MNNRIKELGKAAGLYMEPKYPDGFPNEELSTAEKFAELIVKETMQVLANNLPIDTYHKMALKVIEHFESEQ